MKVLGTLVWMIWFEAFIFITILWIHQEAFHLVHTQSIESENHDVFPNININITIPGLHITDDVPKIIILEDPFGGIYFDQFDSRKVSSAYEVTIKSLKETSLIVNNPCFPKCDMKITSVKKVCNDFLMYTSTILKIKYQSSCSVDYKLKVFENVPEEDSNITRVRHEIAKYYNANFFPSEDYSITNNDGIKDLTEGVGFKLLHEESKVSFPNFLHVTISNRHVNEPKALFVVIESLSDKIFFDISPSRKIYIPISSASNMESGEEIIENIQPVTNLCFPIEKIGTCKSSSALPTIGGIVTNQLTPQINILHMRDTPLCQNCKLMEHTRLYHCQKLTKCQRV